MRRRTPVNVWPAVADLMTVLAVVGLFGALMLEREGQEMKQELREAAHNQQMFEAIQRTQEIVDQISADRRLEFSADQTLQFGDDLVHFDLNSVEPAWAPEGREKLRRFCEVLQETLGRRTEDGTMLREFFTVQVEGHTDSSRCPGDPHCNWWISSSRAAVFVALMRQEEYCPGGALLKLRPIGFADTHAPVNPNSSIRRIELRLAPDYGLLLPGPPKP